jgi:hypothetical protein
MPVSAATYIVPDDATMVAASQGIVTGTVLGAHVRRGESGQIETATEILVEEWIKNDGSRTVVVVHPGGHLGEEGLTVPGVPSFSPGERVLLFLDRNGRGDWTTWAFALGAFRLDSGDVLTRSGGEIFGWSVDGARHVERPRLHREFLEYVRAVARGGQPRAEYFAERSAVANARVQPNATFTSGSYSWPSRGRPLRRNVSGLRVVWRLSGTPGDLDLIEAVDTGIAAWNATSSLISYSRSPTPASGNRRGDDAESRIIANDPMNDMSSQCCIGIVALAFFHDHGTHSFNGQTFGTLTHSDIVLNDGMSSTTLTQALLNDLLAHELGHTLGLRHADKNPADDAPCGAGFNCCIPTDDGGNCVAVMRSALMTKAPGLERWDRDAIACLYEANCTTTCSEPSFLQQPQSRLTYNGSATLLTARVRATPPLAVQWYRGASGDASTPLDAGTWQLRVQPDATTDYWVRVADACGGRIASGTAKVTVVRCPDVTITSASATIVGPGQVRLRTTAAGGGAIRYRWFRSSGDGTPDTLIGTLRDVTIQYTEGARFFVRVENPCDKSAVSAMLTPSETPPPARRRRSRH